MCGRRWLNVLKQVRRVIQQMHQRTDLSISLEESYEAFTGSFIKRALLLLRMTGRPVCLFQVFHVVFLARGHGVSGLPDLHSPPSPFQDLLSLDDDGNTAGASSSSSSSSSSEALSSGRTSSRWGLVKKVVADAGTSKVPA